MQLNNFKYVNANLRQGRKMLHNQKFKNIVGKKSLSLKTDRKNYVALAD